MPHVGLWVMYREQHISSLQSIVSTARVGHFAHPNTPKASNCDGSCRSVWTVWTVERLSVARATRLENTGAHSESCVEVPGTLSGPTRSCRLLAVVLSLDLWFIVMSHVGRREAGRREGLPSPWHRRRPRPLTYPASCSA